MFGALPHYYYTLVASLPALPHFTVADHLPINSVRLRERLNGMLEPEDAALVRQALALVAWQSIPVERGETETVALYRDLSAVERLRPVVGFRADLRTVVAALRRRRAGLPAPRPGEHWGLGAWVPRIERAWDEPWFGLERRLPWIRDLGERIEARDSLGVERLLFDLSWDHFSRFSEGREFRFEGVLAYLFKWDILKRWLSYDAAEAERRFAGFIDTFLRHDDPPDTHRLESAA